MLTVYKNSLSQSSRIFYFKILGKRTPFHLTFVSDQIESQKESLADGVPESSGFQLAFIMSATSCS